jgi:peptidoglycan/xylan/chitin deacetylase (PgdA/CDA1 family)
MKAIMYHYVRREDPDYPFFRFLHFDDFCKQLDYFEENFGFVSKQDFITSLRSCKPAPGIVLTFDDGLSDHFTNVFTELKRRKLWAIFYVCSGLYSTGEILDVHKVHLLLGRFGGKRIHAELLKRINPADLVYEGRQEFQHNTYTSQQNDGYTTEVKRILNYYMSCVAGNRILKDIFREMFASDDNLLNSFYLSVEEIKEMQNSGMIIGSHTNDHWVMSKLDEKAQENQIKSSFEWLQSIIPSERCRTFCYPYGGAHSYNADTEILLKKYGVEFSFSVEPRDIDTNDLLNMNQALPRYDCNLFPYGQAQPI